MIENIYVDGPSSSEFGVTGAIGDLYAELVKRFGSAEALEAAYLEAIGALELEEESMAYPASMPDSRPATAFETAFEEIAQQIHRREGFDADTVFRFVY